MGLQLLKEAREEKYTQAEIAEILGVKGGYLCLLGMW